MQWYPFTSLNKTPIALHFSDHTLTVVGLGAKREITVYGRFIVPEGVIEDGKVLDREKLVALIRHAFASLLPKPIPLDKEIPIVLAVPESKSFTHLFTLPGNIKPDAMTAAVKKKAAQFVPIDLGSLYWDWHLVERSAGATLRVFFAAAPREIIDAYIDVAEECGLLPVAIDMETISYSRALLGGDHVPTAIIDIGSRSTNVGFFDDASRLGLSISIPVAGNAFTSALVEHMHISWEDAEELKQRQGMDRSIPDNRALIILQERMQAILHDFNTAMSYYESSYGKHIERIFICGGSAAVPDIAVYFGMNLRPPVAVGDTYRNIMLTDSVVPEIAHPIFLAPAIGLALRGSLADPTHGAINLLKGWEGERWEERERKILFRWKKLAIPVFSASVILLSYVLYAYLYLPYTRLKEANNSRVVPILEERSILVATGTPPSPTRETSSVTPTPPDVAPTTEPIASTPANATEVVEPPMPVEPPISTSGGTTETPLLSRYVKVTETPTGWLRVRSGPGSTFGEITRIHPNETYILIDSSGDWNKIVLKDGTEGWASATYLAPVNSPTQ